MVLGCMIAAQLGPLIVMLRDRRKSKYSRDIALTAHLWNFYYDMTEEKGLFIVMEDGATIYRSLVTSEWQVIHEISILSWPN